MRKQGNCLKKEIMQGTMPGASMVWPTLGSRKAKEQNRNRSLAENNWSKSFDQKTASPLHTDGGPYTLQWANPFPLKLPIPTGRSGPPSNKWFLGSRAHPRPKPKRHLDRFSHFCRAHDCADRPTDHATSSVTVDRIHVYVVLRCGLKH